MIPESLTSADAQSLPEIGEHVRQIVSRWQDAWNAHDPAALAELVEPDVDFVTVAGRWLQGAQEFADWHTQIHQRNMRNSRWSNARHRLRRLDGDLCVVHLEWTTVGDRTVEGRSRSPRSGVFTWLVARRGGSWRIAAAHNTELRDSSQHRLKD